MKTWFWLSTTFLTALGALAVWTQAQGDTAPPAGRASRAGLKIAVVDVSRILKQYKKADALLEEVKSASEAKNTRLKELIEKRQEIVQSIKDGTVTPDSEEFRDVETRLFQIESYTKTFRSTAQRELQIENLKALTAVYSEIQEVVRLFGEQNGFTLIVKVDNDSPAADDPNELRRIASQDVLYFQEQVDITAPVVAYLNRQYAAESKHNDSESASPAARRGANPTPPSASRKSGTK